MTLEHANNSRYRSKPWRVANWNVFDEKVWGKRKKKKKKMRGERLSNKLDGRFCVPGGGGFIEMQAREATGWVLGSRGQHSRGILNASVFVGVFSSLSRHGTFHLPAIFARWGRCRGTTGCNNTIMHSLTIASHEYRGPRAFTLFLSPLLFFLSFLFFFFFFSLESKERTVNRDEWRSPIDSRSE